ncbi:CLUMA_CG003823, isoform A [Clunio marinus]|uniref:CLUMA_CG003823, isoform A n=1 Tax=Clunio marinus TaxID=568069 RepID=A0A1J1HVC3_9DIPT|nr:CLUMA_CG003823, isoform A [Clunio marinus]
MKIISAAVGDKKVQVRVENYKKLIFS